MTELRVRYQTKKYWLVRCKRGHAEKDRTERLEAVKEAKAAIEYVLAHKGDNLL
jgi:hypothetical protein